MNLSTTFKVVLWMLLLALPAHAVAATSMVHCVRMQRVAIPAPSAIDLKAMQAEVDDVAMPDCHGSAAKKVDVPSAADGDVKLKKVDGKCSACASCCFAVAAVDANIAPTFAPRNQATQFVFTQTAVTFITAGLERPPKHLNT
jgi:hypothetical protein